MKRFLLTTLILIGSNAIAVGDGLPYRDYTVKAGETLNDIAKRHGTTWANLVTENNLSEPTVFVGQKLLISKSLSKAEYENLISKTRPICTAKLECDTKMEAAHLWVSKYADYKIKSSNNVLIETYAPRENTGNIIVEVTKEPYGNSTYAIVITMSCNNPSIFKEYDPMTSCNRNIYKEVVKFHAFVNSY